MTDSIRTAFPGAATAVADGMAPSDHIAERTRLLYLGSRVPALLLLLSTLICGVVLWEDNGGIELGGWIGWMLALGLLWLQQVMAFGKASPEGQADAHWRWRFFLGSSICAVSLSYAMVALIPADAFATQALLYGLIGSVVVAASVAYGVCLPAFFCFAVPSLLPTGLLLMTSGHPVEKMGKDA